MPQPLSALPPSAIGRCGLILVLALTLGLAPGGCQTLERYDRLGDRLAQATGLSDAAALPSRDQIAASPFAQIAVDVAGNRPTVMTLETVQANGDTVWTSSDLVKLVLRGARLVQVAGVPDELRATMALGQDPVAATGRAGLPPVPDGLQTARHVDLDTAQGYRTVVLDCTWHWDEREQVEIAGASFATQVLVEDCSARALPWSFRNRFWLDTASGFAWQSLQHPNRGEPSLIRVLKPAG
ncbi:YjbF family lipoprotein [Zavarzinia sp. CC-PAN008]|uniref:YjbF family lipoprotein n=1 Tax=Zavarzinia sp. CC-PAN008 TaxID=3243332 RepID=UPI003F742166